MNTVMETIQDRRSIRAYEQRRISRDDLEEILACGDAGPSGADNRGWRDVVVRDEATRRKLVERGNENRMVRRGTLNDGARKSSLRGPEDSIPPLEDNRPAANS